MKRSLRDDALIASVALLALLVVVLVAMRPSPTNPDALLSVSFAERAR